MSKNSLACVYLLPISVSTTNSPGGRPRSLTDWPALPRVQLPSHDAVGWGPGSVPRGNATARRADRASGRVPPFPSATRARARGSRPSRWAWCRRVCCLLVDRDAALTELGALGAQETKEAVGPIRVSAAARILHRSSIRKVATVYHRAFTDDAPSFPYYTKD